MMLSFLMYESKEHSANVVAENVHIEADEDGHNMQILCSIVE